jgi:anti-anti-sigma regulatory factor
MIHPLIYFDMRHDIVVTTTNDHTLVRIAGELTVRNAKEIAAVFRGIEGENVLMEVLEPSAIDLSFLQILISCIHRLKESGSQVGLRATLHDADRQLLTNTGFSRLL